MTDPILVAFVVLILCLFTVAASPDRLRGRVCHASTLLSGAGVLLAITARFMTLSPATMQLPFGLPGQAIRLVLDPVASGMLLLLFLAGTPIAAFACETRPRGSAPPSSVPVVLGGLVLAALAADTIIMAAGLSIAAIAIWASMAAGRHRSLALGAMLAAAGGLFVAVALMSPASYVGAASPAAAEGYETAGSLCALAAAGTLAGLVPLHGWLTRTVSHAPASTMALLGGAVAPLALGLMARLAFTDSDTALPVWCAWIPLLLGAATTLTAGWRAATDAEIVSIAVATVQRVVGLAVIDLGLVFLGKAMDLPELAATALAGMMMWAAVLAVCGPLAILATSVLQDGAGSRRADRMGGLLHFMPISGAALLAGLVGMAALPPAAGFAGIYLTFQAILSAPQTPDLIPSLLLAFMVAVQGLGIALGATSAVRTFGIACLGRPRTPRAAAAAEVPRPVRLILLGSTAMSALLGLFPGVVLDVFGSPTITQLTGLELGNRAALLYLRGGAGASHYAPLPLAALLGMCGGVVLWLRRRDGRSAGAAVPVWQDGFPSTTGWMPFGDPLTQSGGVGFVPSGRSPIRLPLLPNLPNARLRHLRLGRDRAALALLLVFAAVLAVLGASG